MNDDTDVLTLLRVAAVDEAPALTLQVDELVRSGRRRRRAKRAVSVGAGLAVAAGLFAFVGGQDDHGSQTPTGPADQVSEAPSAYDAHMMPALLKGVVLPEFAVPTPNWKTFDIAAYGEVEGRNAADPLPERLWAEASRWELRGTTDDHAVELWLQAGDFSSTEGDPEEYCRSRLSEGGLACTHDVLDDGRIVVSQWLRDDRGTAFGAAGDGPWFVQNVAVYRDGSGYLVVARQGVKAPTFEKARADAWLDAAALQRIASNPDVNLEHVLVDPNGSE